MFKNENKTEFFERDPEIKEYYEKNSNIIENHLSDIEKQLGEGATAKVCFLESNKKLCLKVLKHSSGSSSAPYHISLDDEVNFLRELRGIDEDVEVPRPYLSADYSTNENEDGFRFMMMERLNAVSIRDILDGKGRLPVGFSISDFRSKINSFLEKMHNKNIYHRDLHEGNIMIANDNSKIYVIDFGASSKGYGDENPYREELTTDTKIFTRDEDNVVQICNSLRKHILTFKE
jgi:serine/threonine protein kinase